MDEAPAPQPAKGDGWIADLRRLVDRARRPDARKLLALVDALLSGRGEASGTALASEVLKGYKLMVPEERLLFLNALAEYYGADAKRLERAINHYRKEPSAASGVALHAAAEPRRQELIRRLNLAPGATEQLVRMREEVLGALPERPQLAPLDADFMHLLSSWFNRGFLVLQRIDWNTPALILEKIIRYEAVHAISSWDDLRRRIDATDRLCFAFFHPTLAGEPLIFVEVALTTEIPDAIAPLLAEDRVTIDAERASVAVFYSISNCQDGLRGVPLGNLLIKQVAEELKKARPGLKTFVTLSPVPGFAKWLARERKNAASELLTDADRNVLTAIDEPGWHLAASAARTIRPVLNAAVAHYFLQARTDKGRIIDPVARFHLNNGARLERINWLGDTSAKGLAQAAGYMVNYQYDLDDIEKNHEAFANQAQVVASRGVRRLLRTPP